MPVSPLNVLLYNFQQPATRDHVRQCLPLPSTASLAANLDELRALRAGGTVFDLSIIYTHGPKELLLLCCADLGDLPCSIRGPIALLGQIPDDTLEQAIRIGVTECIPWPTDEFLLKAKIDVLVQLRRYQIDMEGLVRQRTQQICQAQDATIEAIAGLVEAKDMLTGKHVQRTKAYLRVLADEMLRQEIYSDVLTPEFADLVVRTAPLHDIGKIGVKDCILNKPGSLDEFEFQAMKKHTAMGGEALKKAAEKTGATEFLECAQQITYYHHEWWDGKGKGYPKGLAGEDIPLCARLMAFADTYDAARFKRQYKPAKPHADVVQEMVAETGTKLDPNITPAFLAVADHFEEIARQFADDA